MLYFWRIDILRMVLSEGRFGKHGRFGGHWWFGGHRRFGGW